MAVERVKVTPHVTKAIPHLPTKNLATTRDWYVRHLGFQAYEHLHDFLILESGAVVLHFHRSDEQVEASGGTFYLNVEGDIDALCVRMRADGALALDEKPSDQAYGKREFTAIDPDGRRVFIGRPIHGLTT